MVMKSRRREKIIFVLGVLVLATAVTAVFTYPLILNWNTHIPEIDVADSLENAWFAWWFDYAIFTLKQSPADLTFLFHPLSVQHPLLTAMAWVRFVPMWGIHFGSSLAATYNTHIFLSYVLTWLFSSLLILELTEHKATAVVAGAIFAFFPNRTMHIFEGHYTLQITYLHPLLVLALLRVWKRPSWQRGVWLGLALALASVVDLTPLAYFTAPITLLLLVFFAIINYKRFLSKPMLTALGIAFGVASIIVLPLILPLFKTAAQGDLTWYQAGGAGDFSADALALFVPLPGHVSTILFNDLYTISDKIHNWGNSTSEAQIYAGWVTLILAGIGIWHGRKHNANVGFWFIIALGTMILAMGPILRLGGELMLLADGRYIIMPYYLAMKIPFLEWGRTPARLHITTMFALMILAGYGLKFVLTRWKRPLTQSIVATIILILILVDSTFIKEWPLLSTAVPAYATTIAADPRPVAVLDIPVNGYRDQKFYMLFQTEHQHPIVGGHAYRTPQEIIDLREEFVATILEEQDISMIADNNIGYIVLHQDFLTPTEIEKFSSALTKMVGEPIIQTSTHTIFKVNVPE